MTKYLPAEKSVSVNGALEIGHSVRDVINARDESVIKARRLSITHVQTDRHLPVCACIKRAVIVNNKKVGYLREVTLIVIITGSPPG